MFAIYNIDLKLMDELGNIFTLIYLFFDALSMSKKFKIFNKFDLYKN